MIGDSLLLEFLELVAGKVAFVGLHTGDATYDNEIAGRSYVRQPVELGVVNKMLKNESVLDYTDLPAAIVAGAGVWDAQVGGKLLLGGKTEAKSLLEGDYARIPLEYLEWSLR